MDFTFWLALAALAVIGLFWLASLVQDVGEMLGELGGAIASGIARLRGQSIPADTGSNRSPELSGAGNGDAYRDYLGTWRGKLPLLIGLGGVAVATWIGNSVYLSSGWVAGLIVWGVGLLVSKGIYEFLDDQIAPPIGTEVPRPRVTATRASTASSAEDTTDEPAGEPMAVVFTAQAATNQDGRSSHDETSGLLTDEFMQLGFDDRPPLRFDLVRLARVAMSARRTPMSVRDHRLDLVLDDETTVSLSRLDGGAVSADELYHGLVLLVVDRLIASGERSADELAYLRELREGQHVQTDEQTSHFTIAVELRMTTTPPSPT